MIELFYFAEDNSYWRYNTSTTTITTPDGKVWLPLAIEREGINLEWGKTDEIAFTVPYNNPVALQFINYMPYAPISISVYQYNPATQTVYNLFVGTIDGCEFDVEKRVAKLTASNINNLFATKIPIRTYSPICSFSLYGTQCGVVASQYAVNAAFSAVTVNGNIISAGVLGNYANGYFTGGYAISNNQSRYILSHTGTSIMVIYPFTNAANGWTFYPGCDKSVSTCKNRFNNVQRYGGFPYVPNVNPIYAL